MNMRLHLLIVHWPGKQRILPGTLLATESLFLQLQVEESRSLQNLQGVV